MTNDILGLATEEVAVQGVTSDEVTTQVGEKPKKRTRKKSAKAKTEEVAVENTSVEESAIPENSGPLPALTDEEKVFDPSESTEAEKPKEESAKVKKQAAKKETKNYVDIDKPIFLYKTSVSKKPIQQIRGRYYFWDSSEVTGRIPVTETEFGIGDLAKLAGWVNAVDVK